MDIISPKGKKLEIREQSLKKLDWEQYWGILVTNKSFKLWLWNFTYHYNYYNDYDCWGIATSFKTFGWMGSKMLHLWIIQHVFLRCILNCIFMSLWGYVQVNAGTQRIQRRDPFRSRTDSYPLSNILYNLSHK